MRLVLILAAIAVSTPAFADPTPAKATLAKAKGQKEIRYDDSDGTLFGHRDVPVAVVLTRDQTIRTQLNSTTDAHLQDAAARR